jgi:peptide/nickel transport system substrate-binding protein
MQQSIDIPTIAQSYYGGQATPWPVSLTQNQLAFSGWGVPYPQWPADLQAQYAYNVSAAKTLMAAAGYPNGFNTNLLLTVSNSVANGDLYQIVQSEFAAIGINMSITVLHDATWNRICFPGCTGLTSDPFSELLKFTTGNMTDIPNVNDPQINSWYAQSATAASPDAVKQILQQANLYVAQQHFEICVAQPNFFYVLQPRVKGVFGPPGAGWPWMPGYSPSANWIDHSSGN